MTYANLQGNVFPPGGHWNTQNWRQLAAQHAKPRRVAAAEAALLKVFTPEWAAAIPDAPHEASPFEHWYHAGGIRRLVKLGCALDIIESPPEVTSDLTVPARFVSRCAEAWSGAFILSLGARLRWLGEGPGPKRPEFLANWGRETAAIEVKGLDQGELEGLMQRISLAHVRAFSIAHATRNVPSPPSRAIFHGVAESLGALIELDERPALAKAEQLAEDLVKDWMGFLTSSPPPGRHQINPRLTVCVLNPGEAGASQFESTVPRPSDLNYWKRLRRRLNNAGKKFSRTGPSGIVVVDRPYFHNWGPDMHGALIRDIQRGAPWSENVGAILVRYEVMAGRTLPGDGIRIFPGPRLNDLP